MTWLIVPNNKLAELETLNEAHTDRKCIPAKTVSNIWVTGADKLKDEYWVDYHEFLEGLEALEGLPIFPIPQEDSALGG